MKFGIILQACRERAGYSQEKMAELLNRTQSCISRFEKDHKLPDIHTLMRWADLTNAREIVVCYMYGVDSISMIQTVLQVSGAA